MNTKTYKVETISGYSNKYQVFYTDYISNETMFNENLAISLLKQTVKEVKVVNAGYSYEV
jgi:hypothetical protein